MMPSLETLEITVSELADWRKSGKPLRLIDCREDDEWEVCKIDGAELMPLSSFAELASRQVTDPDEQMVVYCHHGRRSQLAAHHLRQKGFPNVWSLAGGIELWAVEIDPEMDRY